MAKKKKIRRSKPKFSLAVIAGLAPLAVKVKDGFQFEGMAGGAEQLTRGLTGYSPKNKNWNFDYVKGTVLPAFAGVMVHKLANRLGINRMLKGVPFVNV